MKAVVEAPEPMKEDWAPATILADLRGALQTILNSKRYDLTVRQLAVLLELSTELRTIGQIADALGISRPACSQAVSRLVNLKLVERHRHNTGDLRLVMPIRTMAGHTFLERIAGGKA